MLDHGVLLGMPPERETILVMLSGGIDSTFLLYHYLHDTDAPVHAHHISVRYPHLRWRAEDPASDDVVAWCRSHLRDFEYSTSRFDMEFSCVGWDSDLQLLVASKVAPNLRADSVRVALGWCLDDLERPVIRERMQRGITANVWRALVDSAHGTRLHRDLAMPIVEQGLTKAEVMTRLPSELLALTWSCRRPAFLDDTPVPCGECHACELRAAAGQGGDSGHP